MDWFDRATDLFIESAELLPLRDHDAMICSAQLFCRRITLLEFKSTVCTSMFINVPFKYMIFKLYNTRSHDVLYGEFPYRDWARHIINDMPYLRTERSACSDLLSGIFSTSTSPSFNELRRHVFFNQALTTQLLKYI